MRAHVPTCTHTFHVVVSSTSLIWQACIKFEKMEGGKFDIRIAGFGLDLLVSKVAST